MPSAVLFEASSVAVGKEAVKGGGQAGAGCIAQFTKRDMGRWWPISILINGEHYPPEVIQSPFIR